MSKEAKKVLLKLEAGGKTLMAGTGCCAYKVFGLEGLTGLEFDVNMTSGPQTPNSVIIGRKPLPRQINIEMHTEGENRDFLIGFFNPYQQGVLTVTWGGITRFIRYTPLPVRLEQKTVYRGISADITLICPEPYWLDPDDYGRNIADKQPLLGAPFAFIRGKGPIGAKKTVIPDYKIYNQEVIIKNKGDVPSPAEIVFTARGPVQNPCMTINGGEFVRAVLELQAGDRLAFSTDGDNLYAKLNGADILNETDPDMTFFQIPRGENTIRYSADEGTSNLNAYIYFRSRYVGI